MFLLISFALANLNCIGTTKNLKYKSHSMGINGIIIAAIIIIALIILLTVFICTKRKTLKDIATDQSDSVAI